MGRFFLYPLGVVLFGFSLAGELNGIKELFPSEEIDFILLNQSYLETPKGKFFLKDIRTVFIGNHLYRWVLTFQQPEKVKKKKVLGIKVEVISGGESKTLTLNFWYRGGRILVVNTPQGASFLDLSPKCYLLKENNRWLPKFNTLSRDISWNNQRLHLVFTFTRCEF